ncbi:AGAP005715-PA-like protein [Anopheles sinensis]|uniref:Autophagy-related protein 13 n=1 Tax=Anopheles sinensis TaxID=74873 RepID=A0A084WDN7_ANOSI|nr:AGAP005715-PA-like protein [Anopheles sinensis]
MPTKDGCIQGAPFLSRRDTVVNLDFSLPSKIANRTVSKVGTEGNGRPVTNDGQSIGINSTSTPLSDQPYNWGLANNPLLFACRPFEFNIAITDQQSLLDVLVETKKVLQEGSQHESIVNRLPLCVEISLQTAEGGSMILEFWTLSIRTDQTNAPQRANQVIYNRMSLLLKSLLSVTRVTPAYRVSRLKRSDSYDIYYRIYKGDPQTNQLGK